MTANAIGAGDGAHCQALPVAIHHHRRLPAHRLVPLAKPGQGWPRKAPPERHPDHVPGAAPADRCTLRTAFFHFATWWQASSSPYAAECYAGPTTRMLCTAETDTMRLLRAQVPYSEHSSFTELQEFVSWLRPRRVIPSVNNDGGRKTRQMLQLLGY